MTSLQLSRYKLQAFLNCQRRFQLRYVSKLPWPAAPIPSGLATAFQHGEQFHRLLEQHFRGLSVDLPADTDADLRRWWRNFKSDGPAIPNGERFPELGLSVPIAPIDADLDGGHYLFGRFDLLVLNDKQAHIYDWKTERKPRTALELSENWQTRLYQTMVVEGAAALGKHYQPEQVHITYWFANAPQQSVTLGYSKKQHARNWAELKASVERIDRRLAAPKAIWPLTEDLQQCRNCAFANYCGRDVSPTTQTEDELEAALADLQAEPVLEPVPANTIG